jgi:hypothetical protein
VSNRGKLVNRLQRLNLGIRMRNQAMEERSRKLCSEEYMDGEGQQSNFGNYLKQSVHPFLQRLFCPYRSKFC